MNSKEEMRPKWYLNQIERYDTFIAQKKVEKEKVEKDIKNISDHEQIKKAKKLDSVISNEIMELSQERHKIINEIQSLSKKRYIEVLFSRYVENKSLMEIAVEKNYTYNYIKQLHGYALVEFDNKVLKKRKNSTRR